MATLAVQGSIVSSLLPELDSATVESLRSKPFSANEVTEGLFISDIASSFQTEKLKKIGVTHILNLVPQNTAAYLTEFTYKHVPLLDTTEQDVISFLDETFEFIDKARAGGGVVLVHCEQGVSRSATVVTAYVMRKFGFSKQASLEMVRKARPSVRPNPGFLFQLQLYEDMNYKLQGNTKAHRTYRKRICRSPRTSPDTETDSKIVSPPCGSVAILKPRIVLKPVPSHVFMNLGRSICVTQ